MKTIDEQLDFVKKYRLRIPVENHMKQIFDELNEVNSHVNNDVIYYIHQNIVFFEYYKGTNIILCRTWKYFKKLRKQSDVDDNVLKEVITNLFYKYYKIRNADVLYINEDNYTYNQMNILFNSKYGKF